MAIPIDPDTLLTRAAAAEALTEAGYPTARATLASMATRGGGPIYRLYSSPAYIAGAICLIGTVAAWAADALH